MHYLGSNIPGNELMVAIGWDFCAIVVDSLEALEFRKALSFENLKKSQSDFEFLHREREGLHSILGYNKYIPA